MGGVARWTPTIIFSEVRHGKTKPNRWVERAPKMRNLYRCYCLQMFSKYEKKKTTNNSDPLPRSQYPEG